MVAWLADHGIVSLVFMVGLTVLQDSALVVAQPTQATAEHPFRFGFSRALMPEVSENDAKAAMKVWADTMIRSGAVDANPDALLSPDLAALTAELKNSTLDGVALTVPEFVAMREQVAFDRYVAGFFDGGITDACLLLVHKDSGISKLEDLRGHSLNILQSSRACLVEPWLDTLLMEKGLKPTRSFFGRITEEIKLTKNVLPVFFRKTDACLVTRKGFKTMGELNPQLNQQLRVLATSPEYVPTGFFFRKGYPQRLQDRYLTEFTHVHNTPAGQQILTVFQTERLEEHPASVFDSAIQLLETHRRMLGDTNRAAAESPVTPVNTSKAGE